MSATKIRAKMQVQEVKINTYSEIPKLVAVYGGSTNAWEMGNTGVHFVATADGLEIGSYYDCPKENGPWHKGFRGHFGMTYFSERHVTTAE